jgi:hypothetical protein
MRITLGTDGNRPWGPHEEMLDMVLAGMTPMHFIVLDANPLDDIINTRRISAMILRGAAVDRTQPVH